MMHFKDFPPLRHKEQILTPIEMAKHIHQAQLRLIDVGIAPNQNKIPPENTHKHVERPTHIAQLLRYSPSTRNHLRMLRDTLGEPREFHIVEGVGIDPKPDDPHGNILFSDEQKAYSFIFPTIYTSPYLNPLQAALDSAQNQVVSEISIEGGKLSHAWTVAYEYHNKDSVGSSIGSNPINPSRIMLLRFIYSPNKLEHDFFVKSANKTSNKKNFPIINAPDMVDHVTFTGEQEVDGHRTINYVFNVEGFTNMIANQHEMKEEVRQEYLIALRKMGKELPFTVVELCKIGIGNLEYYVYSGSELPLATEKESIYTRLLQLSNSPI